MALQRPFIFVVAASLPAVVDGCVTDPPRAPDAQRGGTSGATHSDAATAAVDRATAPEVDREVTALREQQIRLTDELRGLRAELSQLSALLRAFLDGAAAGGEHATPVAAAVDPTALPNPEPNPDSPAEPTSAASSASPTALDSPSSPAAPAPPATPRSAAQNWVDVARRLIEDEDYATAVRVLNVAADVDPSCDEIYFQRGVAKHLLQSYADAIDDFQGSIQRATRQDLRYICLYNQACGLARLGRAEEAVDKLVQSDAAGFRDLGEQMSTDPDLDSLRDLQRFRDFAMRLRTR